MTWLICYTECIHDGVKKITIKSKKLQSVGKNALKNIYKKAVISVPKEKKKAYKKLFNGKGQKKTVIIK